MLAVTCLGRYTFIDASNKQFNDKSIASLGAKLTKKIKFAMKKKLTGRMSWFGTNEASVYL